MSNSDIEQTGTVKGHIPNRANLSGRISNVVSLSGNISIGSGSGDFIIKMTIEVNGNNYTVTSCDKTMEQIDAAVASGQNIKAIAFDKYVMPMTQMEYSESYTFGAFIGSFLIAANVYKNPESGTDDWQFYLSPITADIVEYSNASMPSISTVGEALDKLVPNSHTHSNKAVLDKFAETDGKPTYDGKKISGASTAEEVEYTNAILPDASNVKSALDDTIDTQQTQSADLESLRAGVSALINAYETQGGDIASLKTQAHTHSNKSVLDKFAETDGKPTYDGEALGSDFIIKMNVTSDDNGNYTVTSCDATIEQIDAAVAAGKGAVVIASGGGIIYELPMIQYIQGTNCIFSAFSSGMVIYSSVYKVENKSEWNFYVGSIPADNVDYSNAVLPNISTVSEALDELVPNSHTHSNKAVLDKFAESDGKPTYNGEALGGDFIIKMTVESHDEGYFTVTSCDTTIEQIDAAVAAEKRVVVIATDTTSGGFWELPIVEAYQGATYMFIAYTYGRRMMATVYKSGENEIWEFTEGGISAESIDYFNSTQPDVESVHAALNKLFTNSHTHANKDTLDKLSVSNGKLQYNGSDVGLKPVKGTDYWTAADKTEIVNDTLAALPTWTGGSY